MRLVYPGILNSFDGQGADEGRFEAPFPSLLDAAEGVVAAGVSLDHALTVTGKARDRCRSISRDFVELFLEDIWKPFEDDGYPEDRWPAVRQALDQLRPLTCRHWRPSTG